MKKELCRREFLIQSLRAGLIASAGLVLLSTSGCGSLASGIGAYVVNSSRCSGCGDCLKACKYNAISIQGDSAVISTSRCAECGKCVGYCKQQAISSN